MSKIYLYISFFAFTAFALSLLNVDKAFAYCSYGCHGEGRYCIFSYTYECDPTCASVPTCHEDSAHQTSCSNDPTFKCDGGGCFTADTKINTTDGEKNITEVKTGDVVLGFDPDTQKIEENVVEMPYTYEDSSYYNIETNDGSSVKVTAEHPFYVGNGDESLSFSRLKDVLLSYFKTGLDSLSSRR